MTRYISLDALVAEIERIKDEEIGIGLNAYEMGEENGKVEMCDKFLSFLDTLEVKEVDINKEIEKELDSQRWKGEYIDTKKFRESAKHFFELGMAVRQVFPRFYKTSIETI